VALAAWRAQALTIGGALAATLVGTAALAQSTTVIEKRDTAPTTVIEKRDSPAVIEKRSVETTGTVGCSTTTKEKTDAFGDTKVKQKTEC
jgi:hypothetical protein